MKPMYPNNLGRALVQFFQDYLPAQRGMSAHTIRSYRDAIVLFLRFAAQDAGRPVWMRHSTARRQTSVWMVR